ncbi:hypothetical protein GIB67_013262 [Kingdonia uniflora]|uniref:Uncharacterized protein n=1 Tax=Kingdonia uniflora TaxID=39325 RepID=A0A7J7N6X7_9MAGN|nr:hypothetical protein GIB67_013262 [Kingdonia uniflora]
MATLQFKDDCDSMKVGLREFDSSWTWQANELRAIDSSKGHNHQSLASTDANVKSSLEKRHWEVLVRQEALRRPLWRVRQIGVLRSGETFGDAGVAITLPAAKLGADAI